VQHVVLCALSVVDRVLEGVTCGVLRRRRKKGAGGSSVLDCFVVCFQPINRSKVITDQWRKRERGKCNAKCNGNGNGNGNGNRDGNRNGMHANENENEKQ